MPAASATKYRTISHLFLTRTMLAVLQDLGLQRIMIHLYQDSQQQMKSKHKGNGSKIHQELGIGNADVTVL
jgi:hypothetical protein